MAAGATYEAIATTTLGSAQSSVTFSSIPSTYTDLVVAIAPIGTADLQILATFNNDSGTNYSDTILAGNGTSASSARVSNDTRMVLDYFFSTTTSGGAVIFQVMNYSNTTTFKTALSRANNAGKGVNANVCLWRSTSAINRIDFIASQNNFASGSTFTLYGIAAA